ncbi:related to NADPH-dependent FMN and FAD containing oxidoreductase (NR1) [Sporisorium reilianum SRZ2]|uniref:NADPH-dependent diflavin oxidoreductase 1 n=1 Tax=Sporisorium reilianum (strain SRZ2) TaxID=999809 RepID=E6ZSF1_SPORE|nr:related to NADPH-dependent FMN and FAD containing oxidoreductase (NR1) [Sporisorium reilianum SRZ2]
MTSIRASSTSSPSPPNSVDEAATGAERHLTILYMTQTGTSQDLAQRIARHAQRKRFSVTVADVAEYDAADLVGEPLVLFLVSTTGQGEFPTTARAFWHFLLRKGIPEDILADVHFAAFGLGDTTYPRFCWPVRLLSRRLKALGAVEVVRHGEGDEMHYLGLEGELAPWLERFWAWVDAMLPMPEGWREVGRDEVLAPATRVGVVQGGEADEVGEEAFARFLEEQGWLRSRLGKNERMTAAEHFQDVRLLEFVDPPATPEQSSSNASNGSNGSNGNAAHSITSSTYRPGDVLCLHPINDDASVTEMLSRLNLDGATRITLSGSTVPSTVPQSPHTMTLTHLFTHHLDFTAVPTRSFFDQIRLFSPAGSLEREKLDEYCGIFAADELAKGANAQDGIDEMFEYAQRPRRTIKEVLEEFKSVAVPLGHVADVFPWIKPREFSIASAPPRAKEAHAIQLSVAIVRYKTRLRKARTGLCTRWLATLRVDTQVPILLKRGYLTLPPREAPLILLGPGTGCAPLRSLVLDRLRDTAPAQIHLFLGFRSRANDFLFQHDWQTLQQHHANTLHLHTAFSRDTEHKTYVQDLVVRPENAQVLWSAIVDGGAWIVVAGASGRMPEQVRAAFETLARTCGGMDEEQARRFLDSLERARRWQEECWG